MNLLSRIKQSSRELLLFATAALTLGMALSIVGATFNNFLNDRFALSGFERSFLEFPRELPGFLVVFVSAALWFLCSRRLGVVTMILSATGAALIGFASSSYWVMVAWLFIYSLGDHLFMPIASTIGMELAREGQDGRRLGQLNAIRNFAAILGSFSVVLGFKYLGFSFQHTFAIAAVLLVAAAALLFMMKPEPVVEKRGFLQLHREYRLYYILNVLSGARKQLFITFAPWVLVSVLRQPTQIMATLFTIGGVIGILFQPLLGWSIDKFGERTVLASEAVILVFVCFGYGFAKFLLPADTAFLVVCACFLIDQMIFSVSMARATYMKKIAIQPDHIQPALTAAVTIDHVFSISAALLGGVVWNVFGFQYVFLFGAIIAVINFFTALRVRTPQKVISRSGIGQRQEGL
ncbi:MAG: MFS transporter [Anaerolineales bacterium]|nr:MFS transporter [Anaerolineales bacterium]